MKTQNLYYLKQLFNDVKTDYKCLKFIPETIADKLQTKISQNKNHWHSVCLALHFSYVLMFDDDYLILSIINTTFTADLQPVTAMSRKRLPPNGCNRNNDNEKHL